MRKLLFILFTIFFCYPLNAQFIATAGGGVITLVSGEGLIGTLTDNTTDVGCDEEKIWHSKFQPTVAGTVSWGHLWIIDGNSAAMCISIFSSDGTELASGASADVGDGSTGWVNIEMDTPVEVSGSTDYYLGFQVSAEVLIGRHYIEGVTGYRYYDGSYTYDCGGSVNAEESTGTGSERELVIIFNNSSGDPD